jgi:hypothetical protein
MIFRKVSGHDFEQIKLLYKKMLNFDMSKVFYEYLYFLNGNYCSVVAEVDERIIAHNAIIPKKYIINNKEALIGLSSGGMVDLDYSGVFFNLLRYGIKNFQGDGIIAFPNKNSEPFFTKLLKFNLVAENYFSMEVNDLNFHFKSLHSSKTILRSDSLKYRINKHPKNEYLKLVNNDTFIIYKKFSNEVDLIFVSEFNKDLINMLKILFNKGFEKINFIYGSTKEPISIGFRKVENNVFTYKWINKDFKGIKFNCQMIDSDVF